MYCSVLQSIAVCFNLFQCIFFLICSVNLSTPPLYKPCVAVCCTMLHCVSDSVFSKDALLSHIRERKRTGIPLNPCLVGRRVVPTARWTSKAHRVTSDTQQRHCARSSVTNVLSLEENSPQATSLSNLLEMHEINFEENWRYRTLSKLETLF